MQTLQAFVFPVTNFHLFLEAYYEFDLLGISEDLHDYYWHLRTRRQSSHLEPN